MSLYRWQVHARLADGMTERRVDGSGLQLVTVCLLELAELAERRGEVDDARA